MTETDCEYCKAFKAKYKCDEIMDCLHEHMRIQFDRWDTYLQNGRVDDHMDEIAMYYFVETCMNELLKEVQCNHLATPMCVFRFSYGNVQHSIEDDFFKTFESVASFGGFVRHVSEQGTIEPHVSAAVEYYLRKCIEHNDIYMHKVYKPIFSALLGLPALAPAADPAIRNGDVLPVPAEFPDMLYHAILGEWEAAWNSFYYTKRNDTGPFRLYKEAVRKIVHEKYLIMNEQNAVSSHGLLHVGSHF